MNTRILLALADDAIQSSTRAAFDEVADVEIVGAVETSNDVFVVLTDAELDIVIVHDSVGPLPALALCREIMQRRPDVAVVLMADHSDERLLSQAMDSGVRAVVGAPPTLGDLQNRLPSVISWVRGVRALGTGRDAAGRDVGRCLAVVGAKGGVGTTMVATNLALIASRATRERRVCLVDLDLQRGGVMHLLDLTAKRSFVDLAPVADNVSGRNIEETVVVHRTGLRVLCGPKEGEQSEEVDASAARQLLAAIRGHFDLVIVDCGSVLNEASATALELADEILLMASTDVPALRAARDKVSMLSRLQIAKEDDVTTLVNRASSRNDVQPDLARRIVGTDVCRVALPADWRSLQDVSNAGRPEDLQDGPFRRAMHALARELRLLTPVPGTEPTEPPTASKKQGRSMFGRRQPEPPGPVPADDQKVGARSERGQIAVEAVVGLAVAVFVMLVLAQVALYTMGLVAAGRAADAAALTAVRSEDGVAARQAQAQEAAEQRTPGYFDVVVTESSGGAGTYEADVGVPVLLPFMGGIEVTSVASATN